MKKAFTLAEILLTLGIVGIVSAITIPTLIQNYKKKVTVESLKKEYSSLLQTFKMYQAYNNVDFDEIDTSLPDETFMQTYILPYMETIGVCENSTKCYKKYPLGLNRKSPIVIYNKLYIKKNGAFIGISQNPPTGKVFFVDINGSKGPNYAGRDIFYFFLVNKKTIDYNYNYISCGNNVKKLNSGLYAGGYSQCYILFTTLTRDKILGKDGHIDRACSKQNGAAAAGDGCAALIMVDGWKIEKDYPW